MQRLIDVMSIPQQAGDAKAAIDRERRNPDGLRTPQLYDVVLIVPLHEVFIDEGQVIIKRQVLSDTRDEAWRKAGVQVQGALIG